MHGLYRSLLFHLASGPASARWNFKELQHPETVAVLGLYVLLMLFHQPYVS